MRKRILFGSPNRARTCDIMINSHALYRLSYRGILSFSRTVMRTSLHRRIVAASPSQASVRLLLALGGFASHKPSFRRFLLATTELSRNVVFVFVGRKQTTLRLARVTVAVLFQISTENRIKVKRNSCEASFAFEF